MPRLKLQIKYGDKKLYTISGSPEPLQGTKALETYLWPKFKEAIELIIKEGHIEKFEQRVE
jgi:hypothetical protein